MICWQNRFGVLCMIQILLFIYLFLSCFQGKVFPKWKHILCQKKSLGSYALKSILKARRVISLGARWKVGDGKSIRVCNESWMLGNSGGRVLLLPLELSGDSCVADLINNNTGWWDIRKIDKCFLPFEAQSIKSIPLCSNPQSDYFFWPLAGDDIYTVKTGYKLLCGVAREEAASVSNSENIKTFRSGLEIKKSQAKLSISCGRSVPIVCQQKQICLKEKSSRIPHAIYVAV